MNENLEYKGIFYGTRSEHKYYEGGAHFSYQALVKALKDIKEQQIKNNSLLLPKDSNNEIINGNKKRIEILSIDKQRNNSMINLNVNNKIISINNKILNKNKINEKNLNHSNSSIKFNQITQYFKFNGNNNKNNIKNNIFRNDDNNNITSINNNNLNHTNINNDNKMSTINMPMIYNKSQINKNTNEKSDIYDILENNNNIINNQNNNKIINKVNSTIGFNDGLYKKFHLINNYNDKQSKVSRNKKNNSSSISQSNYNGNSTNTIYRLNNKYNISTLSSSKKYLLRSIDKGDNEKNNFNIVGGGVLYNSNTNNINNIGKINLHRKKIKGLKKYIFSNNNIDKVNKDYLNMSIFNLQGNKFSDFFQLKAKNNFDIHNRSNSKVSVLKYNHNNPISNETNYKKIIIMNKMDNNYIKK